MIERQQLFRRRFEELLAQGQQIPVRGNQVRTADPTAFYAWATSVLNLFISIFGSASPHTRHFESEITRIQNNFVSETHLQSCRGVFQGAKADFDGGYLFNVEVAVSGEVFGDFVASAKFALAEGHHTVAAVLASAALEDALKRYCLLNDIAVEGKSMSDLVNALKAKGLVAGAEKGLLGAMPKLRDYAMHAQWERLTPQDAGSIIGYVEQFLLSHFS